MNVAKYLAGMSKFMMQVMPDHQITAFFLAKRGLQRLMILYHFLKDEKMPEKQFVSMAGATQEDWKDYISSNDSQSILCYLLDAIISTREHFEKVFQEVTDVLKQSDPSLKSHINDSLNISCDKVLIVTI